MAQSVRTVKRSPYATQGAAPPFIPAAQQPLPDPATGKVNALKNVTSSTSPYGQQGVAPQRQFIPASGNQAPEASAATAFHNVESSSSAYGHLGAAPQLQFEQQDTEPQSTLPPAGAVTIYPPVASTTESVVPNPPLREPDRQLGSQMIAPTAAPTADAQTPGAAATGMPAVTGMVGQEMGVPPRQTKVAAIAQAHENRVRIEVEAYKEAEVAKVGAEAAKVVTLAEKILEHEKAQAVEQQIKSEEKADHILYNAKVKANRLVAKAKEGMIVTKAKHRQKTEKQVATAVYKAETAKAEAEEQKVRKVADIEYKLASTPAGPMQGTEKLREEAKTAEVSAVKVMTRVESKKQQVVEKATEALVKKEHKVERHVTNSEVKADHLVADAKVKQAQVKELAEQLKEQKILEATQRAEAVKKQAMGNKDQQVAEIENKVEQMVASKELPPHPAPTMVEKIKLKLVGHT